MPSYNGGSNTWKRRRINSGGIGSAKAFFRGLCSSYDSLGFILLHVLASFEFGNKRTEAVPERAHNDSVQRQEVASGYSSKEMQENFPQQYPSKAESNPPCSLSHQSIVKGKT